MLSVLNSIKKLNLCHIHILFSMKIFKISFFLIIKVIQRLAGHRQDGAVALLPIPSIRYN